VTFNPASGTSNWIRASPMQGTALTRSVDDPKIDVGAVALVEVKVPLALSREEDHWIPTRANDVWTDGRTSKNVHSSLVEATCVCYWSPRSNERMKISGIHQSMACPGSLKLSNSTHVLWFQLVKLGRAICAGRANLDDPSKQRSLWVALGNGATSIEERSLTRY
jgi:hypothetical protein